MISKLTSLIQDNFGRYHRPGEPVKLIGQWKGTGYAPNSISCGMGARHKRNSAATGNLTPNVILNANSFTFSSPSHLAFDAAGNLWVVDEDLANTNGGAGEVFKFTTG